MKLSDLRIIIKEQRILEDHLRSVQDDSYKCATACSLYLLLLYLISYLLLYLHIVGVPPPAR